MDAIEEALQFATHQQLINELRKRHSVMYFIGKPKAELGYEWHDSWEEENGDIYRVIGLIEVGKALLIED